MQITEIMTPGVENVDLTDSIVTAAAKMRDKDIGALVVVDKDNGLHGILTDRDIVTRCIARELDPAESMAQAVMTEGVVTCPKTATLEQAGELMEERQIRRLLIVDDDKALGIVSLGDLAVKSAGYELAGEVIEKVSEPAAPER